MDRYYQPSSIRIFDSKHMPVGTGIYVGDRLILTCEHVVSQAQSRKRANTDGEVAFDFAYDGRPLGTPKPSARVLGLWRDRAVRSFGPLYDVAVLEINVPETIPADASAAPLSEVPDAPNEQGHVFGFANDAGLSVTVRCGHQRTDTLVELFFDHAQAPVAGGHSGSPVWNASQQVIGMVIERDDASSDNAPPKAYMLPVAQFDLALANFQPKDPRPMANDDSVIGSGPVKTPDMDLDLFSTKDLEDLAERVRNSVRLARKSISGLPESAVPLIRLHEIDELETRLATYEVEITRRRRG